jgi:hypothetical protein
LKRFRVQFDEGRRWCEVEGVMEDDWMTERGGFLMAREWRER